MSRNGPRPASAQAVGSKTNFACAAVWPTPGELSGSAKYSRILRATSGPISRTAQQLVLGRLHQAFESAEMLRQLARGVLAHMANAETVDQALERSVARTLDTVDNVLRAFFGHPFELGQILGVQLIDIAKLTNQSLFPPTGRPAYRLDHRYRAQFLEAKWRIDSRIRAGQLTLTQT